MVFAPSLALADITVQFTGSGSATSAPGSIVNINGTISNTSSTTPVYVNQLFNLNIIPSNQIASTTSGAVVIDQVSSSSFLPQLIYPGQQIVSKLVTINIASNASPGEYLGMYGLAGGEDSNATSVLATQYFILTVTGNAPAAPSGLSLTSGGTTSNNSFTGLQMPSDSGSITGEFDTVNCSTGLCMNAEVTTEPRLIKILEDPTVYWVSENKLKIPMLSEKVFLSYNNKWEDVKTVDKTEFDAYQDAKYIWLNGKGAIYYIKDGVKRYIPSSLWNASGLGAEDVINVNKTDFNAYSTGAVLESME